MKPQNAIFVEGTAHHYVLEFRAPASQPSRQTFGSLVAELQEAAVGGTPMATVSLAIGFGPALAAAMIDDLPPIRPFEGVQAGPGRSSLAIAANAPSTQADLFIWAHSQAIDRNFDLALRARQLLLAAGFELVSDVAGWAYHGGRDLTGFIDGTENPDVEEARDLILLHDDPGAGGTYAFTQRWIHNLNDFGALGDAEQEAVIGRTKPDSVELEPAPDDSHIGRVVIEDDDGDELEVYRRSFPYGTVSEHGLYFLAFTGEQEIVEAMLAAMYGHDGPADRLLDFTRPVSGAWYFMPSVDTLNSLAE